MSTKCMDKYLQCLSILICVLCLELTFVKGNSRCSKFNPPSINTNISINSTHGTIYSPDYSLISPYPSNTHCDWTISGPVGYVIKLTFELFELEPSASSNKNCVDVDLVRVYDGLTSSSSLLGVYCGTLGKFSVRSKRRFMLIQFRSNLRVDNKGFRADYEVVKSAGQEPPSEGKQVSIALIIVGVTVSLIIVIGIIFLAAGGKDSLIRKRARRRLSRLNIRSSRVSMNSAQAPLPSMKSWSRSTNSETQSLRGSISSNRPLMSSRVFPSRNYSLPQLVVTNEDGKETMILPQRELRTHVIIHTSPLTKKRLNGLRRLSAGSPTPPSIRRNNQISPLATHAQAYLTGTQKTLPTKTRTAAGFRRHSSGSIR